MPHGAILLLSRIILRSAAPASSPMSAAPLTLRSMPCAAFPLRVLSMLLALFLSTWSNAFFKSIRASTLARCSLLLAVGGCLVRTPSGNFQTSAAPSCLTTGNQSLSSGICYFGFRVVIVDFGRQSSPEFVRVRRPGSPLGFAKVRLSSPKFARVR